MYGLVRWLLWYFGLEGIRLYIMMDENGMDVPETIFALLP